MPFGKAQRRKFAQLLVEGKIKDETYEEWNRSTGRKGLPERVTPKSPGGTRPGAKGQLQGEDRAETEGRDDQDQVKSQVR